MRRTVLLLLLALVASACQIRTDVTLELNADETGTLGFEFGFDEEFRQLAESEGGGGDFSLTGFDQLAGNTPDGWSVTDFDDGEFAGTRISTPFSSLADLDRQLAIMEAESSDDPTSDILDTLTVTRDGDTFRFEATLAQLDQTLVDAGTEGFDLGIDPTQFFDELLMFRFVVTMPGDVTSHNADVVDGSTLVWQVPLDGQSKTLRATSGSGGGGSLTTILVAAVGLALLGLLALTVMRRRQESVALYEPPSFSEATDDAPTPVGADPFSS